MSAAAEMIAGVGSMEWIVGVEDGGEMRIMQWIQGFLIGVFLVPSFNT